MFEPDTLFTPQTGSWGLHGIVRLKDRPNDFVFMVTFGKHQGDHAFDEGISTEGVLRWQSQPRQSLSDKTVRQLIAHDEDAGSIFLFLRTRSNANGAAHDYTYLGRLSYAGHDTERERPVYFAWHLLSWPIPEHVVTAMDLHLEQEVSLPLDVEMAQAGAVLIQESPPEQGAQRGEITRSFKASKRSRRSEDANRVLGLEGEVLVLDHERQELRKAGRGDLAEKVVHTSVLEGDGAGFDIMSYSPDGRRKFIEVKTTSGPKNSDFFVSSNEVAFAKSHLESYELWRIFDFDFRSRTGKFYVMSGAVFLQLDRAATQYRVGRFVSDTSESGGESRKESVETANQISNGRR